MSKPIFFLALVAASILCGGGCGGGGGGNKKAKPAMAVAIQQVVLHSTMASNDQATVLIDGNPAVIVGNTWSGTVSVVARPQDVVITMQTNGITVEESTVTIR